MKSVKILLSVLALSATAFVTTGSAQAYTSALACSGNATQLSGNVLTVTAGDGSIVVGGYTEVAGGSHDFACATCHASVGTYAQTHANGTRDVGFWFLKDGTVGCTASGGKNSKFTGNHVDGDLLIVAEYTGGGSGTAWYLLDTTRMIKPLVFDEVLTKVARLLERRELAW